MSTTDKTPRPSPQRPLQRLLHIDASGAEVAIDYALVRHIGSFGKMTRVPQGDEIHERVAIFKGSIVPVIDIRGGSQTGEAASATEFPDFLVLALPDRQEGGLLVGVRVDRVIEILLVPAHDIQSLHASAPADFITGVVWLRARRLPLVNMHCLLQPAALQAMHHHEHCSGRRVHDEKACPAPTYWRQARSDAARAPASE